MTVDWRFMWLAALLLAGGLGGSVSAGSGDELYRNPEGYTYYDVWWEEYKSDTETKLLLHFSPPRVPEWARLGNAKVAEAEEADASGEIDALLEEADDEAAPGEMFDDFQQQQLEQFKQRTGRRRSAKAPAGKIFDYSPNKSAAVLPDGVKKVEEGRFGKALRLTGRTGLKVVLGEKGGAHAIEGWFKPDGLPEQTVCLLASKATGVRLLLLPDGRIELLREAGERQERISVTSDKAITPGEWTHIAAYLFQYKHIEGGRGRKMELRLGLNAEVVARKPGKFRMPRNWARRFDFADRGLFYIGMNPDGEQVYTGLVDEVRVASRRRYNKRDDLSWRDPKAEREIPFGPPHFQKDARIFHASFESREMTVHPPGQPRIQWDLGEHADFQDMQAPGVYGKAVVIDPAFGSLRIPIQGLSPKEGTFEMWLQPVNWDNHTDFGKIAWPAHQFSIARFMGRDTRTGKIVPFMEFSFYHATMHGVHDWFHPGQWSHLIWSWSPDDVYEEDQHWGSNPPKKGDPLGVFRAFREGEQIWKGMLRRNTDLLGHIELLYLELGIPDDITVRYGQRPTIMVDEVVGHSYSFTDEELRKAPKRWKNQLDAND